MKKIIILFALFISLPVVSQWENAGFVQNPNTGSFKSVIRSDSTGKLYVAYRHSNQKAAVKEYDGTTWQQVGESNKGFSDGAIGNIDLAFDNNNVPYVVYEDWANLLKITVKKFDGTAWVDVSKAFTPAQGNNPIVAFDSNNTLYVAYIDRTIFSSKEMSVMKFNGSSWEYVGERFFSGSVGDMDFVLGNDDTPYVSFSSFINGNEGKTSVMKFNGTAWEYVGPQGFSTGLSEYNNIVVSKTNELYISFNSDTETESNLNVLKFNGTTWDYLGDAGLSLIAERQELYIDDSNNLYIAFRKLNNVSLQVKKWNTVSWDLLGGADVDLTGFRPSITKASGVVYVNYATGSSLIVKKYQEATASVNDYTKNSMLLSIYPNPATTTIAISLKNNTNINKVEFYNLIGQKVLSKKFKNQSIIQVNTSHLPSGLYTVKAYTDNEAISKKIIIN